MREQLYIGSNVVVVNLSVGYYQAADELISSDGFKLFLKRYLEDLAGRNIEIFNWLVSGRELEEIIPEIVRVTKLLQVLAVDEIDNPLLNGNNRMKALYIVEDAYNYWRKKQRFSIVDDLGSDFSYESFMEIDTRYNQLVLQIYRKCEEKLQGHLNKVYRQLQAGTNASSVIKNYKWDVYPGYGILKNIGFIKTVMLRTPIIFHPGYNKRDGFFKEIDENPVKSLRINYQEWFCFPIKVGGLLCFAYFHRDFISSGMSLANLFELASEEECVDAKPELMCFIGNKDDKDECGFYHDEENDVWIGSVSYNYKVEYFGYMKKMILTLHNLAKMQRGSLPIHGSMMRIFFNDGTYKSMVLMGDSGAGKSESVEAVKHMSAKDTGDKKIVKMEVIFDDMGALSIVDGEVVANGTETGAFVRLDDLDKSTAYQDMERSIFFSPETTNARVVAPASSYELINQNHKVDMFLYANNYQDNVGVERFDEYNKGKQVFIDGKRMALGTTQEKGLSSTFFANPFGPMQKQQQCLEIMEKVFGKLYENNVYVGQIFTCLGTEHKENINESAKELLELLKTI